jgi:hypothetical protein
MYEFDPVDMMFACIIEAAKVEEININIDDFCAKVNHPSCTP